MVYLARLKQPRCVSSVIKMAFSRGSQWINLVRKAMNGVGATMSKESIADKMKSLQMIMKQLKADELKLSPKIAEKDWTCDGQYFKSACIEVERTGDYCVCVFLLRPNYRIPLHDHPGMHGVMKVLFGQLELQSYTPLNSSPHRKAKSFEADTESRDGLLPNHSSNGLPEYTHRLQNCATVTPDSSPCLLDPVSGNVHEVVALDESVAFMDILTPPYSPDQNRDCTYYAISQVSEDRTLARLKVVTNQYHDFYCLPIEHDLGL